MTGKFSARHRITNWIGEKSGKDWRNMKRHDKMLPADYAHRLPQNEITIAEAMRSNGYKTFFAGKWHLGDKGSYPEDHGFDINRGGYEKGGAKGGYFSPLIIRN
jgi:arylsulfatase A-like enzyme